MKNSHLLLRRGRRLLSLLAILALLLGALPALALELDTPTIKTIHTTDRTCVLEWNPVRDAEYYIISRSIDSGTPERVADVTDTSYADSSLQFGHHYAYTVTAAKDYYGGSVYSPPSAAKATVPVASPEALSAYENSPPDQPTVTLNWHAVTNADGYEVRRTGSDGSNVVFITNHHWLEDEMDLQIYKTYQYTVTAYGLNSQSALSDVFEIELIGVLVLPRLVIKAVGDTVYLTWNAVLLAVRYEVLRNINGAMYEADVYPTTDTHFSQSGLSYDLTYGYTVGAYSAGAGMSGFSSPRQINLLRPPVLTRLSEYGPPTMPAVKLSWNAVNHADSYQVYRSVNGGAYTFLKGTTALSINDNSVQLGKTYYYKVKACSNATDYLPAGVESFLSDLRGIRVVGVLAAPTISSLTSASNSAYLKWAPVAGAKSYAIYRAVNGGAFQFLKGTTGLSIADAGLTYGALYSYRVQAKADSGAASPMSASRSIRIPAQPAAPAISSLSLAGTTATLAWGKVNGAISYYIYRSVNGGAYSFLKGTTATFIKDSGLEMGKTYAYRVRANANAGVYSALSAARSIKVAALATPVIASLANGGTTTATLTWGAVSGATSYTIYRSVNGGAYSFLKGTTATFIKDAGLTMGSSYAYKVQANGAGGLQSSLSAPRSITIK